MLTDTALVTLAELKIALTIGSGQGEDAKLLQALNAAVDRVEKETRRVLKRRTYTSVRYDGHNRYELLDLEWPIVSISALKVDTLAQTIWFPGDAGEPKDQDVVVKGSASDLAWSQHYLHRFSRWPLGIGNIQITYTAGYGYLAATLTTAMAGSNNDLMYTARIGGAIGNRITVAYDVSGNNTPLAVSVSGEAIIVHVATNGSGVATSTASQVREAVEESVVASDLVLVSLASGNDGTGVVTALAATALSGGADTGFPIPESLKEATLLLSADAYLKRDRQTWQSTSVSINGQNVTYNPPALRLRAGDLMAPFVRPPAF